MHIRKTVEIIYPVFFNEQSDLLTTFFKFAEFLQFTVQRKIC